MKKLIIAVLLMILLAAPALAADVTLSWQYATGMENVEGFRIYASTTSGQYTSDDVIATIDYQTGTAEYATDATLTGQAGQETLYYFVGTAYNTDQESPYSNEVSYPVLGTFTLELLTE